MSTKINEVPSDGIEGLRQNWRNVSVSFRLSKRQMQQLSGEEIQSMLIFLELFIHEAMRTETQPA